MNSIDIVENMLHHKKYDAVTEFAKIEHPERGTLVITEYAGNIVSAYKDDNGVTKVMIPRSMDLVQEGTVATEIANGTIFDDAEEATNNAEMIEKISIPYNAMINSGKDTPKKLKPMIAIVIGKLDTPEDVGVSDNDRITGNNFVHDLVECNNKNRSVDDVVDNYIGKDKESFHTPEMGHDVADLNKEVSDIRDTKSEDVISDDDTVEDYCGKIPQSGDFDDYLDDDETDDVEDSAEDDKESDGKTESDEEEDADDNDESEDDEDDDDIVDEYNVDSSDYDIFMESKNRERDKAPRNDIAKWMNDRGYWYMGDNPKKKKECNRMYHFLQQHKFNPSDGTYESSIKIKDGGYKRLRLVIDPTDDLSPDAKKRYSELREMHNKGDRLTEEEAGELEMIDQVTVVSRDIRAGKNASYTSGDKIISMGSKKLKGKQVYSQLTLKHEEGHALADLVRNEKRLQGFMNSADKFIKAASESGVHINNHDSNPEELFADRYAVEKGRIRTKKSSTGDRSINDTDLKKQFDDFARCLHETGISSLALYQSIHDDINKTIANCNRILNGDKISPEDVNEMVNEMRSFADSKFDKYLSIPTMVAYLNKTGKIFGMIAKILIGVPADSMRNIADAINDKSKETAGKLTSIARKIDLFSDTVSAKIKQKVYEKSAKKVYTNDMKQSLKECITHLEEVERWYKDMVDVHKKFVDSSSKMRYDYAKQFVKESVEPELNPNTIRQFDDVYDEEEINAIQEAFFSKKPKKLKPIPRDVVAYITVEMNAISSSNDQAMLSGYTCSKIELVDFYLTVLDTQDPRYIVPHTKQYLETMKRDLENLLTQILRIRPINRNDRIWRVNVNYPEGRM